MFARSANLHAISLGLVLLHSAFVFDGASAQNTGAVCLGNFSWTFNSLAQSPCVVASYLEGACVDTVFSIAALPAGRHYVGPVDPSDANPCICSSVAYNLVSACGVCQGSDEVEKWTSWITNCTGVEITSNGYGHAIPSGTAIPAWAFQSVTSGSGVFDASEAESVANENLPDTFPTGGSSGGTGSTGGSNNSSSSSSSTNIGAIVGGVVGGVIVIGLIITLIVYFSIKRKRAHAAPSSAYSQNGHYPATAPEKESLYPSSTPAPYPTPYATDPYSLTGTPAPPPPSGGFGFGPQTDYAPSMSPRVYDPNDPSTYPGYNPSAAVHSPQPVPLSHTPAPQTPYGYGSQYAPTPASYAHTTAGGGGYSGAPEI